MSSTYFSWAFPAEPKDVSADVSSLEDAGIFLAKVPEDRLLMSASRNNWLLDNLKILSVARRLPHLQRLENVATVFSVSEVPSVFEEIESLLMFARDAPESIAAALNPPCDVAEVSEALESSTEAETPHLGPSGAEEGDAPKYLFSWLKSLHALLIYAHRSGLCTVHVQPRSQA
jgi:hypothetical protein